MVCCFPARKSQMFKKSFPSTKNIRFVNALRFSCDLSYRSSDKSRPVQSRVRESRRRSRDHPDFKSRNNLPLMRILRCTARCMLHRRQLSVASAFIFSRPANRQPKSNTPYRSYRFHLKQRYRMCELTMHSNGSGDAGVHTECINARCARRGMRLSREYY